MKKIVNMQELIENKRQKKQLERYRGSVETVQKIIQCSSCHFRCAMCGLRPETTDTSEDPQAKTSGLTFCRDCKAEFEEFLAISKGEKQPDVFWHNQEWLNIWSAWLDYRKAITAFVASPEFELLVEEINNDS